MALTLTFDPPSKVVSEPGFFHRYPGHEIASISAISQRYVWTEPLFGTQMLKPLQLDPSWLGTVQQHDSIVRLAELFVEAGDLSSLRVVEKPRGTNDDPWIYHGPVGPSAAFPLAPMPGAPPSLTGVDSPGGDLTNIVASPPSLPTEPAPNLTIHPPDIYTPSPSVPPSGSPPVPVPAGGWPDAKIIAISNFKTEPNQAMFFRWIHSNTVFLGRTSYVFSVGQYDLWIRDSNIEIFEDTSPHGDRTAGRKVFTYPLWSTGTEAEVHRSWLSNFTVPVLSSATAGQRSLLWLPFRRNKVLLLADTGRACYIQTRPDTRIKRNADNTDWENVREDILRVKCLSPLMGEFQVQRVKYAAQGKLNGPITLLHYTPAGSPVIAEYKDADRGTSLSYTPSTPPSYSIAKNPLDDCTTTADPPTSLVSRHGIVFTLSASTDRRRTPFLYGYDFQTPRVLIDSTVTSVDVDDTGIDSRILSAKFTLGKGPGEGKGTVEVVEIDPYPLATRYSRGSIPITLKDGATAVFTGFTDPMEMTPLTGQTGAPRRLVVPMVDSWKLLTRTVLSDRYDWTGVGHITAVLETAKLAGVDTTGAETPPINTTALDRRWNTPLFGTQAVGVQSGVIAAPWATGPAERAASFIQRVADVFSGWDVGFRADGKLFYLPRDYYTTPSLTFYPSQAAADTAGAPTAPLYRDPVVFKAEEPEANVISVQSGKASEGGVINSPLFIDWASIKNPNVVNYLGHWRQETPEIFGGLTCQQVTWIARTIWMQTRRRRVTIEFATTYRTGLDIGDAITVSGYGDYRVTAIEATFERDTWHPAVVTGELIEKGYGLPT